MATFTDANPSPNISDFTASIDWGDGSITPGTVTPDGSGGFRVIGTHTYSASGMYNTKVAIVDAGGSKASGDGLVTVDPDVLTTPNAPQLIAKDDTGASDIDGFTRNNGSSKAPLAFTVTGINPANSFVQLYELTEPGMVALGTATRAVNGTATITLAGGANLPLRDGIYHIAATASATAGGVQSGLSAVTGITVQTSLFLTTSPAENASIAALPLDQLGNPSITLNFSHPIAGLTDGEPALAAADSSVLSLTAAGQALEISTVYHIHSDGTSAIVVTPAAPPAAAIYSLSVDLASFPDVAGNIAAGPPGGNFTFTVNGPPDAPVTINPIAPATIEATQGTLTVQVTTTDPDLGRTLVYSLPHGAPSGAAINPSTGLFTWAPTVAQGGTTYSIAINVAVAGTPSVNNTAIFSVTVTLPPPAVVRHVSIQKIKTAKKKTTEVIELQFNQAMNAVDAQSIQSYSLVTVPKSKKQKSKPFPLAKASYDASTFTVTLTTRKALVLNPPLKLTGKALNLLDALGRPLNGGVNFVAVLSKAGITVTSAVPLARPTGLTAAAVDAVLETMARPENP